MIKISQNEAKFLRENGRGFDVHVSSKTHKSRAKRYYLTESKGSLKMLAQYRKQTAVKEG